MSDELPSVASNQPPADRRAPAPEPAREVPLRGRVIALAEGRDLDTLAAMLSEIGAQPLRCPMVSILDAPDAAAVERFLRALADGAFTDLILLTGEGLRRLLGFARRAGIEPQVIAALSKLRKITRGPKPARALTEIGLRPDLPAAIPTTEGIIADLSAEAAAGKLRDRRFGVQLYGQEPNRRLIDFLSESGAAVQSVAPYIYAPAADDQRILSLVDDLCGGKIDVIAFTSAAQVERLWQVAEAHRIEPQLIAGLHRVRVAAVGPVVAGELQKHGVQIDIKPEKNFFMRSLVKQIVAALAPAPEGGK